MRCCARPAGNEQAVFIEVNNISKTFRSRETGQPPRMILDAIDFAAEEGEIVSLLGRNGVKLDGQPVQGDACLSVGLPFTIGRTVLRVTRA